MNTGIVSVSAESGLVQTESLYLFLFAEKSDLDTDGQQNHAGLTPKCPEVKPKHAQSDENTNGTAPVPSSSSTMSNSSDLVNTNNGLLTQKSTVLLDSSPGQDQNMDNINEGENDDLMEESVVIDSEGDGPVSSNSNNSVSRSMDDGYNTLSVESILGDSPASQPKEEGSFNTSSRNDLTNMVRDSGSLDDIVAGSSIEADQSHHSVKQENEQIKTDVESTDRKREGSESADHLLERSPPDGCVGNAINTPSEVRSELNEGKFALCLPINIRTYWTSFSKIKLIQ